MLRHHTRLGLIFFSTLVELHCLVVFVVSDPLWILTCCTSVYLSTATPVKPRRQGSSWNRVWQPRRSFIESLSVPVVNPVRQRRAVLHLDLRLAHRPVLVCLCYQLHTQRRYLFRPTVAAMADMSLDNYLEGPTLHINQIHLHGFISKHGVANFLNVPYAKVPTRFRTTTPITILDLPIDLVIC